MKKLLVITLGICSFFIVLLKFFEGSFAPEVNAEENFILIGTGSVTGVYYPAGGAICRVVNRLRRDHGIRCSAESTSGSLTNIEELNSKRVDLSIVQSDIGYEAVNGIGEFVVDGPDKKLRSIFSIHDDAFTIITRSDSGIQKFEDIKGQKINLGSSGSGARAIMEMLMGVYGWQHSDFPQIYELKSTEQAEALCSRKIDVMIDSVGHPNASLQEATSLCDTTIISISGDKIEQLIAEHPYYVRTKILGGTYAGNPEDVDTFAVKATLVARDDLDDETVYQVTKSVFDNFDIFRGLHPVFLTLDPKKMVKEGIIAPLHEGAKRYYKEHGFLND